MLFRFDKPFYKDSFLKYLLTKSSYPLNIVTGLPKTYLGNMSIRRAYNTRNVDYIPCFNTKHSFSRNSFSPSTLIEWNNLDINIRNSESFATFKKSILRFIRPSENPIFNCYNPSGIELITRLRVGFICVTITNL